jgi:tRNA threonylcarbamoyladenosine biosynthesis protein TsaB
MSAPSLLLALHSSTERFGVAVLDPNVGDLPQPAVFDDGRALSNTLLKRVESVLPAPRWSGLQGLAVATGPGGFTGTRLTVVMARTLAQQLRVPLVGVSSFALMAARLCGRLSDPSDRFWITRELPRRGVVGGAYQLNDGAVEELEPPHLLQPGRSLGPMVLEAHDDVEADVICLLNRLQTALSRGQACPWQSVLPIYPTSPVGVV